MKKVFLVLSILSCFRLVALSDTTSAHVVAVDEKDSFVEQSQNGVIAAKILYFAKKWFPGIISMGLLALAAPALVMLFGEWNETMQDAYDSRRGPVQSLRRSIADNWKRDAALPVVFIGVYVLASKSVCTIYDMYKAVRFSMTNKVQQGSFKNDGTVQESAE